MTCTEVRRLLSVRREWTRGEQVLAEAHLADCPACAAIAREYEGMDRQLGGMPKPELVVASRAAAWARVQRQENVRVPSRPWQRRAMQAVALVSVLGLVALGVMLSVGPAPSGQEPGIVRPDSSPGTLPPGGIVPANPAGTNGRINLLLAGIDRRGGSASGYRTDAILIVTVDPAAKTAAMLSIPRDLLVEIPGFGENRINTANAYGYLHDGYFQTPPLSGPLLLKKTIEANFGIPIDSYVVMDFEAFVEAVDMLGGIDVDVPQTLHDDEYPDPRPNDPNAYTTVHFNAGPQHMDGERALAYVRSRMSTSDFDRAKRQQLVLLAIREKALDVDLIPKLPELMARMDDKIKTDLTLEKLVELATLLPQIDPANVKQVVLEEPAVYPSRSEKGAAVLLPRWDLIRPLVNQMFALGQATVDRYTVQVNDTVRSIAQQFGLQPETILWSNPDLEQYPDFLAVGQDLVIPPMDGVLHTVQPGDTLQNLADRYGTPVEKIVSYEPNGLQASKTLVPGTQIMLPDGTKGMPATDLYPMPATGSAPASAPKGSGHFYWPAEGILTQPYWSGHPGIDIGNSAGTPIRAADRGYVVLAGLDTRGYGNQIVIDHGNGYVTRYAHLQTLDVRAGDPVEVAQKLGTMGTTGQVTGPQLHFELIHDGVRIDPLQLLP